MTNCSGNNWRTPLAVLNVGGAAAVAEAAVAAELLPGIVGPQAAR